MSSNLRSLIGRSTPLVALLVSVIIIWLPFGFNLAGLIEEWVALRMFTEGGPLYFITKHTMFAAHRMRPFTLLPQSIAFTLDSGSFLYWHLLQILAIFLKGAGIASIFFWLSSDRRLSLFAGLLMIVYPADMMQLAFRSLHINWAVALTIWAIALLLKSTEENRKGPRIALASCGSLAIVVASFHYEASLFFTPFPLILWWAKYGSNGGLRRLATQGVPILSWILGCVVVASYVGVASVATDLYQTGVGGSPLVTLKLMVHNLPMLVKVAFYQLSIHGWIDALRMYRVHLFLPHLLLAIILATVVFALWKPASERHHRDEPVPIWRCFVAGLLGAALGYLPYLSSLPHIYISQRTYLFATIGASIAAASLLALVWRQFPRVASLLAVAASVTGLHAQWVQFDHYNVLSNRQKAVLASIIEAMPNVPVGKRILIMDPSGLAGNTWMLRGELMGNALTYLYGYPVDVEVCGGKDDRLEWESLAVLPNGSPGICQKTAAGYEIGRGVLSQPKYLPNESFVILHLNPDGTVISDTPPGTLKVGQRERLARVLGCWPASACRTNIQAPPRGSFEYDFGTWWSLEDAQWGVGWRDAEWDLGLKPRSFSWKQNDFASMSFRLAPLDTPYQLEFKLQTWVSQNAHDTIKVKLNDHEVPVAWTTPFHLVGTVDRAWLHAGVNELTLESPVDKLQGVDLAVDSVVLRPVRR